jgi:RNA polymerase sigma-70 factor (ECF subfamily)
VTDRASKLVVTERPAASAARTTIAFDDLAMVERCRKGDMQGFALLVAKYQDRVMNLVSRLCPRAADAEDLAQEVFLKALEKLGTFRGGSQFYTWLFRIAVNMAVSQRRRDGRIRFRPLGDGDEIGSSQAATLMAAAQRRFPSPDASAISAETGAIVSAALEELEEELRVVVVLRDIEDMSYEEIAQVLEAPAGTVKSRLHRARLALREKLAKLVQ